MRHEGDVISDEPLAPARAPARRVLLAEDDQELRWLIAHSLRNSGFDVVEVDDGLALLDRVGNSLLDSLELAEIDLIVSDVRMPGWTGLEVLAGLNSAGCPTPVVLITAFGDQEVHAAAKRLGAVAVLDKPFELNELTTLAARVLEQKSPATNRWNR
ncbi:MAG TPA: response regulator [Polyangiaceae bacterium]|jgi:CheY-like chemotaxis protein|nr:response regulator [Polyangiaceae bacterium]